MEGISICITVNNQSNVLRYCLEGISRQDYDGKLEVCVVDSGSDDGLITLLDRYSDVIKFKYAKSVPMQTAIPAIYETRISDFNAMVKHMASYDTILKLDADVVMLDNWIIPEMIDVGVFHTNRPLNARVHYTEGDTWYMNFDDIVRNYTNHYLVMDGGPLTRSKTYLCSAFNKKDFIELGGIEELLLHGVGYDDMLFREMWNKKYKNYEFEITGQAVRLWQPPKQYPTTVEEINRRIYERLKVAPSANSIRVVDGELKLEKAEWGIPEAISKVYNIRDGAITSVDIPCASSLDVDLPL